MAGIYIHIPFCQQKCNYCDFYSIVSLKHKTELVQSILKEIEIRANYLEDKKIETIYFGGGTPSLLNKNEIESILNQISKHFSTSKNMEITFEANPENITEDYLKQIRNLGINRLSMGVQSFANDDLEFLKRTHSSEQASTAVKIAQNMGFDNISLDLIYGLPRSTVQTWEKNLKTLFSLKVQHLSAYHLIYEEGTALYHKLKRGKIKAVDEDTSLEQFKLLIDYVVQNSFEMYEISSYAHNQAYSKHNLSYWQQKSYLGIGPSAHSFNQKERAWNSTNINQYISAIQTNKPTFEKEVLSPTDLLNEYLITRLRTKWGLIQVDFEQKFGEKLWKEICIKSEKYQKSKTIILDEVGIRLSKSGIFISDKIMEDLFILEEG